MFLGTRIERGPMDKERNYIFISYSHQDKDMVIPLIERLEERHEVWYDKEIKHGKDWASFITNKITNCSMFLFLVTNNSLASENCMDEISFAKDHKIPFINVIMEDVSFPPSFELRYGRIQMCFRSNYADMDDFMNALDKDMASEIDAISMRKDIDLGDFEIEGTILKGYKGKSEKVVVPESVTEIGFEAFAYNETLKSVIIPGNVNVIGTQAFIGCENLSSVSLGNGISSLGDHAFADCVSLKSISLPYSVTSIGKAAFSDCVKLKSITMNDKVASLGEYAFSHCEKLTSITLPEGLETIPLCAFENCISLRSIELPESLTSIEAAAFMECSALEEVEIHEGLKTVGDSAFNGCASLRRIRLPMSLTSIGASSFEACSSLESVVLPRGVTSIGNAAFRACELLKTASIPNTLERVGDQAFFDCPSLEPNEDGKALYLGNASNPYLYLLKPINEKIKGCKVNEKCRFIASYAFSRCEKLKTLTLPEGLVSIGYSAFQECKSIKSLILPNSIRHIGGGAFSECGSLIHGLCFNGTKDNWGCLDPNEIYKIGIDPTHTAFTVLHCTDGDVKIL